MTEKEYLQEFTKFFLDATHRTISPQTAIDLFLNDMPGRQDNGYQAVAFEVGKSLEDAQAQSEQRRRLLEISDLRVRRMSARIDELEARLTKAHDAKRTTEELQLTTAAALDEANAQLAEATRERREAIKRAGDYAEQVNQVIDKFASANDAKEIAECDAYRYSTKIAELELELAQSGQWEGMYDAQRERAEAAEVRAEAAEKVADAAARAALAPRPPHTHYCQHCAGRWNCKDGNCRGGELKGCVPEVDTVAPTPVLPWPAGEDAREACREAEGK